MTSTDSSFTSKRVNESSKKSSPLKVVSPIIKKYNGQRQGRVKKKLDLPRRLTPGKSKNVSQTKPSLKSILPKTNSGDVIIVESELIPCALNIPTKKKRDSETETSIVDIAPKSSLNSEEKLTNCSSLKEAALKANKPKVNSNTKRKKYLKNIETTCTLLKPEAEALKDKRDHAFAVNYLQAVQKKLKGKDDPLYAQFVNLICEFQKQGISVTELYKKVKEMFSNHVDLGQDFIAFLTPVQAMECGVLIEHLLLTTMTDFLNMIDVYFPKSPQQVKKIHSVLENLSLKKSLTTEDVKNAVLPLLKGNTVLQDYFLQLLPHGAPPTNFLMDFEEVDYPELSSDFSEDEERYEIVKMPEIEDLFGGDSCPCNCHDSEDEKFKSKSAHCTPCSVKYINGKIFIQQGKLLRPAKVTFGDHDLAYHRDRLAPKLYPKRGIKKSRASIFKENLSPTKSCNLSSDEFKSDIEEDDRNKSKMALMKSPRSAVRKMSSPKNCDKSSAKVILSDFKVDGTDAEEKPTAKSVVDDPTKLEKLSPEQIPSVCDWAATDTQMKIGKTEETQNKALDLPQIDVDEPVFECPAHQSEQKTRIHSPILFGKDGSRSPPVISIPDSANPSLFPSGKPILSFLETLDSSKEPTLLVSDGDAIINIDSESSKAGDNSLVDQNANGESKKESKSPWKIEEDRIILQTLQVEENCEETFRKINNKIPSRSLEDIKSRFANLMNMLYEMKAKTKKKDEVS